MLFLLTNVNGRNCTPSTLTSHFSTFTFPNYEDCSFEKASAAERTCSLHTRHSVKFRLEVGPSTGYDFEPELGPQDRSRVVLVITRLVYTVNSWRMSWSGSSEELFVDLIFNGKSQVREFV